VPDVQAQTVVDTVAVGDSPEGVGVNTATNKIYVANANDDTVSVIDGSTDTVVDTVAVGDSPEGVGVNTATNKIYVANAGDDTVSVIDGSTDTVIDTVTVGDSPFGVGVNTATNKIYVANVFDDTVSVIDGSTDTVVDTVTVGDGPFGVGVNTATNKIYVSNFSDDTVSVIDGSTDTVVDTVAVGDVPFGVGVNTATDKIYVSNFSDNTVSVISDPPPASSDGGGSGCRGDCEPPTLGVDREQKRIVSNGFSYNGNEVDVEHYYTPYPLITVNTGVQNTATFKIYENTGPDNISHFDFAFGLAEGQILAQSNARIEWDRSFDGAETVTVIDPQNALDDVSILSDTGPCSGGATQCLILTIQHTFREPLEFDIVATNVWDQSRNSWQNYYNHGIHVTGESLNPPDQYDGIYKGHIYHLTETGKNTAVDEFGDTWSFEKGIWNKDYTMKQRPADGDWMVFDRYHSGFGDALTEQQQIAEDTIAKICAECRDIPYDKMHDIITMQYTESISKLQDPDVVMKMLEEHNKAEEKMRQLFYWQYFGWKN